jgi:hypothetical protein
MICIADLHESQDPTFQRKKAEFRRTAENSHPCIWSLTLLTPGCSKWIITLFSKETSILCRCLTLNGKICSFIFSSLKISLSLKFGSVLSQHRPDAEGLISILKCLKAKSYVLSLPGRVLYSPRPSCTQNEANAFSLWNNILESNTNKI